MRSVRALSALAVSLILTGCASVTDVASSDSSVSGVVSKDTAVEIVSKAKIGVAACADYLHQGTPLSSLADKGFRASRSAWTSNQSGIFGRGARVYAKDNQNCSVSYGDSILGINGAQALAKESLLDSGYKLSTETLSSGKSRVVFVKIGKSLRVSTLFSNGAIAIRLAD